MSQENYRVKKMDISLQREISFLWRTYKINTKETAVKQ